MGLLPIKIFFRFFNRAMGRSRKAQLAEETFKKVGNVGKRRKSVATTNASDLAISPPEKEQEFQGCESETSSLLPVVTPEPALTAPLSTKESAAEIVRNEESVAAAAKAKAKAKGRPKGSKNRQATKAEQLVTPNMTPRVVGDVIYSIKKERADFDVPFLDLEFHNKAKIPIRNASSGEPEGEMMKLFPGDKEKKLKKV